MDSDTALVTKPRRKVRPEGQPVHLRPMKDAAKRLAVYNAMAAFDLPSTPRWTDIEALSPCTQLDEIQAIPDGVFETDEGFVAVGTLYVKLNDIEELPPYPAVVDFPVEATGHFRGRGAKVAAVIDSFEVKLDFLMGIPLLPR